MTVAILVFLRFDEKLAVTRYCRKKTSHPLRRIVIVEQHGDCNSIALWGDNFTFPVRIFRRSENRSAPTVKIKYILYVLL